MAINQPPKQDNSAFAAWLLELTREIARLEERIRQLETRN